MNRTIFELLEKTAEKFPDKIIYEDINRGDTYSKYIENCKKIGTSLAKKVNDINKPIAIFVDRSVTCLEAMRGGKL